MSSAISSTTTPPIGTGTPFAFDNSYARELDGLYVPWQAARAPDPRLLYLNSALTDELGLELDRAPRCSAATCPPGATPIAQAYAGHQFGGFSPQLGDGRALLLGEVIDRAGPAARHRLQGLGPHALLARRRRQGRGRPMLREVLIGEAMHALGIPTTRALAVVATGEPVVRDRPLPGAVLTRVAASHLRVGTFQYFAAAASRRAAPLADYAIARHDPALAGRRPAPRLLQGVAQRQARSSRSG
jgi:uncharacterized protein YdiU (UPF0061 family)